MAGHVTHARICVTTNCSTPVDGDMLPDSFRGQLCFSLDLLVRPLTRHRSICSLLYESVNAFGLQMCHSLTCTVERDDGLYNIVEYNLQTVFEAAQSDVTL